MSYWLERLKEIEVQQKRAETPLTIEHIPAISLAEFARRDIAIEVHSSVLGSTVWFCSDKEMAAQIKRENPEAVCYTQAELRHLISLNPGPESLLKLHEVKQVFGGSIVQSTPLEGVTE